MGKGDGGIRANLHATRAQMNNASTSAQTRAFKARQIAKQKRDVIERKLREAQVAARAANAGAGTPPAADEAAPSDGPASSRPRE